jgi:hypothetical protein
MKVAERLHAAWDLANTLKIFGCKKGMKKPNYFLMITTLACHSTCSLFCDYDAGLVVGGMDKLGYVPLSKALQKCEGRTGYRVRTELDRYITLTLDEIYSRCG